MRAWIAALWMLFAGAAWAQAPSNYTVTPELTARAEAGDDEAMHELSIAYMSQGDWAQATNWMRRAAEAGRVEAMGNLAAMLREQGQPEEAADWHRRALAAGSDIARLNEGSYRVFTSTTTDEEWAQALQYLRDIRNERTALGIANLAERYETAPFRRPDRVRALTQLAAERNAPAAQWRYAMMLREGYGGPHDVPQAFEWARRAGEGGDVNGIISTAVMLATGEGVALDPVAAAQWYQRAIDQHQSAHALRGLSGMYLSGELPAEPARGWAYLELAAEAGDRMAPTLMQRFQDQATPQVRAAARLIADAWRAQHGRAR